MKKLTRLLSLCLLLTTLSGAAVVFKPEILSRSQAPLPEVLRLGVTRSGWMPFIGSADSLPLKGMSGEMIEDFAHEADVKIEVVPFDNFQLLLAGLKNGQIDFASDVVPSRERQPHFRFTQAYMNSHHGIIQHQDQPPQFSLEGLAGHSVALEKGFYRATELQKNHPHIHLQLVSSTEEALRVVSEGKADAYVGNLEVANYLINDQLIPNLRVSTALQSDLQHLSFAVRKDLPALQQALNSFIDSGKKMHYFDHLRVKWTTHSYNSVNSYNALMTQTGFGLALGASLLLLTGLWILQMRRTLNQRDQARRALEEKQADLKLILNNINQGIIRSDADREVRFLNQPSYIDFDLSPEELERIDLYRLAETQLVDVELPEEKRQIIHQAISENSEAEVRLESPNRILDVHYQPLPDGGALITYADVSAQALHEHELREAKQVAEQAAHTKANFLANMSHEIRTPMNGILGMLELLEHSELSGEQRRNLGEIQQSAESLLVIINDILDFSKLDAGAMQLSLKGGNLRNSIERVCNNLGVLAGKKGLKFYLDIEPEIATELKFDPVRIEQILTNLIGNAIKFTLNGFVRVQVRLIKTLGNLQVLQFVIQDTGVGIEPEVLKQLFSPFQQADASTSRRFGGTGLGLSICKKLAEAMDARLQLKSLPGQGSRAELLVPLEIVDSGATCGNDLAGIQVNLCCTEQAVSDTVETLLNHRGASVRRLAPTDLAQILSLEETDSVCILNNPVWNRSEIHELISTKTLPVINLITEPYLSSLGCGDHFIELGGNPLFPSQLLAVIDQILGRRVATPDYLPQPLAKVEAKSIEQAEQDRELILLVEDHATNRQVLLKQLNLLGYTAEVACDGEEGLTAWRSGRFQMIITDCHMPRMDGYAMSRAIREAEAGNGRMPIIALTASVLDGEKEKCLAAGMDDYITKPANLDSLKAMLATWFPRAIGHPQAITLKTPAPIAKEVPTCAEQNEPPPYDAAQLAEFFEAEELCDLLADFAQSTQADWQALKDAYGTQELERIKHFAHRIKGASRTIYAQAVADSAEEIEHAARDGLWHEVERLWQELEQRITHLLDALEEQPV